MKKYILITAFLICGTAFGQQLPQYTQYMFNQYAFNPAYAGVKTNWEAVSNNRYQWVGITDAPRTFTLAINGPLKSEKMGLGGYLYTDVVGPTRRIGFQTSFSYKINITEDVRLSFGLSVGFNQWVLDADKITTYHPDDYYFSNGLLKSFDPDGKFGIYLYDEDWYFGASVEQIFQDRLSFSTAQIGAESILEDHYHIHGGYDFKIGDSWKIQPSALIKIAPPVFPVKVDLTLRATYKDMVWAGIGVRTKDAITTMFGFNYRNMLSFGYAYDITTTDWKNYTSGTHEILLGITFGDVNSK